MKKQRFYRSALAVCLALALAFGSPAAALADADPAGGGISETAASAGSEIPDETTTSEENGPEADLTETEQAGEKDSVEGKSSQESEASTESETQPETEAPAESETQAETEASAETGTQPEDIPLSEEPEADSVNLLSAGSGNVVYVGGESASDENDGGSKEQAVATLKVAFSKLQEKTGGSEDGTIVLCGTVAESGGGFTAASHTGVYTVTGQYEEESYPAAEIQIAAPTNIDFGGSVILEHLKVAAKDNNCNIYANTSLTVAESVITEIGSGKKLILYGGARSGNFGESRLEVNCSEATFTSIIAANKNPVKKVTIILGSGVTVSDKLIAGGMSKAAPVEEIDLTVSGAAASKLYLFGYADAVVGSSVIRLKNGANISAITTDKAAVTGDLTLEVSADSTIVSDGGVVVKDHVDGTATLVCSGYAGGAEISNVNPESFDGLTLAGGSDASYTQKLPEGYQVNVQSGSTLKLSAYANLEELESGGVTAAGTGILKCADEVPYVPTPVVYIGGESADDTHDGRSKEQAVATLKKAFEKLQEKTGGSRNGTIIVCGTVEENSAAATKAKYTAATHTGVYTITGQYEGESYPAAEIQIATPTNIDFGGPVILEHLKWAAKDNNCNIYANASLTVAESVTTEIGSGKKLILYGGALSGSFGESRLEVNCTATFTSIIAANGNAVEKVTVILGSGVTVLDKLVASGMNANGTVGEVDLSVNGATVNIFWAIYNKAQVGSSTIRLNGAKISSLECGTGKVTGDLNLEIDADTAVSAGNSAPVKDHVDGTATVTYNGYLDGAELSNLMPDVFDGLTLTGNSYAVYKGELADGYTVNVEEGSALRLSHYTEEEAQGLHLSTPGRGLVLYGPDPATEGPIEVSELTVYVNGQAPISQDGTTPETAVRTLEEAYQMLTERYQLPDGTNLTDAKNSGKIIFCGDTTLAGPVNFQERLEYAHEGSLTVTSVNGAVFHADTSSGNVYIQTCGPTLWDGITVDLIGSKELLFYSGYSFTTGEDFHTAHNGAMTVRTDKDTKFGVRAGFIWDEKYDGKTPTEIILNGGIWRNIYAGNHVHHVTQSTVTVAKNGVVSSYIECGTVGTEKAMSVGDITVNIDEGGYSNALYLYSFLGKGQNLEMGSLTVNIRGSLYKFVLQRNYKNLDNGSGGETAIRKGGMTVNLYPTGSISGAKSGEYDLENNYNYVEGKLVYNALGYQGGDYYGMELYDVVNLCGSAEPDGSFDQAPEADGRLLQIRGYSGAINLDLEPFDEVRVSGNSSATYMGTFPVGTKITVEEGSVLYIRPSQNPGKTAADFPYSGEGEVVFGEPEYSDPGAVLLADFNAKDAADVSGSGNNGVLTGSPVWGTGYDGSPAVYLTNVFGKTAQNYITFGDLKGVDLTSDSYSVVFWYKTVGGGNNEWALADYASTAGSGINMPLAARGGIVFSNQDTADPANPGMSAAQLTQSQFFAAGVTAQDGTHRDVDNVSAPQDGRWHQVAVVFDRAGSVSVYVDNTLVKSADISALAGEALGVNTLALGADVKGQYGLGSAYVDDFAVYAEVLSQTDIEANYYVGRLKALIAQAEERVASVGPEYSGADRREMRAKIAEVKAASADYTAADYEDAMRLYDELKAALDAFLLKPSDSAKLSMLLLSDIHGNSAMLETVIKDITEMGISLDGIVNSGDFADDSKASATDAAYAAMSGLLEKYGHTDWQMIASFGNHEIQYTNASENYLVSTEAYWRNLQAYISDGAERLYGDGKLLETYYEAGSHYCYLMELDGYRFLVLNTDYVTQTGNSKDAKDGSGYSSEGNLLDPIRHGVHFDEETFTWIRTVLDKYTKDAEPIFVINHFPFIDSVPLSYYREIIINDNSIGRQDREIRNMLAEYDNVVYFCGHLHSALGMCGPATVYARAEDDTNTAIRLNPDGGSFTTVNLPSLKSSARAYQALPAGWMMFVYDTEIVLRARNYATGEWLTEYDAVIPISGAERTQSPIEIGNINESNTVTVGEEDFQLEVHGGADELEYEYVSSDPSVLTVDENGKIHLVGPGKATVTVTKRGSGFVTQSASIEITVLAAGAGGSAEQPPVPQSPATGDPGTAFIWMRLCMMSMAALCAAAVLYRRRKNAG